MFQKKIPLKKKFIDFLMKFFFITEVLPELAFEKPYKQKNLNLKI